MFPDPGGLQHLRTPALGIDLDAVRSNIDRVIALINGDPLRWRPHLKTSKLRPVYQLLLDAGVRACKCATIREMVLMADAAARHACSMDLLFAYPPLGPNIALLERIAAHWPQHAVSVICEDAQHAASLPASLGVYVDLNVGMDRTGAPFSDGQSVKAIAAAVGARFKGVHAYDGQFHRATFNSRLDEIAACHEHIADAAATLIRHGCAIEEVITSGTPTFVQAAANVCWNALDNVRHTVSPGTVVLHDGRSQQEMPELELQPAACVLSRVISHPTSTRWTMDAGSKAIAADAGDPVATMLHDNCGIAQCPSEEHLPFECVSNETTPPCGSLHWLFPRHVCPTVNLADEAMIIKGGQIISFVPIEGHGHLRQDEDPITSIVH